MTSSFTRFSVGTRFPARARVSAGWAARAFLAAALVLPLLGLEPALSAEPQTAKQLFGGMTLPSKTAPASFGSYAKGCLSGAVALPADGPTWQAMRLSRNRRWGNPHMIMFLERFSRDAAEIGWGSGILLGDISQPRGGPMLTGHASHQIGLDADIWFQPKPARAMSVAERETRPFVSMLDKTKFLTVNPERWTPTHARLLMRAASEPEVDRVFVNPAIKKKLCETWTGDRTAMGKIRPIYGHDEHFHIRIKCPADSPGCKPQAAVAPGDGCDKSLAWWFTQEPWAKPKPNPDAKPVKPRFVMLSDLPQACSGVLAAPSSSEAASTFGGAVPVSGPASAPVSAFAPAAIMPPATIDDPSVPVPTRRPLAGGVQ
ncbi:penicillin-insensitive murein endopeptidase [Rhizobium sp. DKSPLA3]|uniref:Penicillin-insensitive murein endopeptidase n=1 Tax=Rhizobium quercicola TaxID=2901226 RepID=A0A9X1T1I0_9HYPH|nr:penicillin-insensitive murein endopeptidase [Rhizobium quercicola]MCD7110124.1 penicillin-insensitive murein endopeptidase [Rhizobium quercicola]